MGSEQGDNDFDRLFLAWFEDTTYQIGFDSDEVKEQFGRSLQQDTNGRYGNEALLQELHGLSLEQLNWRRYKIRNDAALEGLSGFQREYPSTPEDAFRNATGKYVNSTIMDFHKSRSKPPVFICDVRENRRNTNGV